MVIDGPSQISLDCAGRVELADILKAEPSLVWVRAELQQMPSLEDHGGGGTHRERCSLTQEREE